MLADYLKTFLKQQYSILYSHLYIGDKIISDFLNLSQYGYLVLTRHLRCELVWEQTYENWMWPVVNVYEYEMKYIVSSSE